MADWISDGILSDRLPLIVHSNQALIMPRQVFRHPEMYISFTAKLISAALCYRNLIEDNEIPTEMAGKIPLDMSQNMNLFGSCRIPACEKDGHYRLDPFNPPNHIIVAHNNNFFRVPVLNSCGVPITSKQIEAQLQKVVHDSRDPGKAVGILTTEHRDTWAELHNEMTKDNKELLEDIETALFMVCLDGRSSHTLPASRGNNLQTIAALKILHGGGPQDSAANRWFDKTLQFIVGCTGEVGLCLEQSYVDCQLVMNLLTYVLDAIGKTHPDFCVESVEFPEPIKLEFCSNFKIDCAIKCAEQKAKKLIDDTGILSFTFTGFGFCFLESHSVCPDGFVQLALLLAYHRVHAETVPSYELASTRRFCRGRTEVVRTTTPEALFFIYAMLDECNMSDKEKAEALLRATDTVTLRTIEAMDGQGVDRHIFGLYMMARQEGLEIPELFCNKGFQQSCNCKLFTNQVRSPYNAGLCLGPASYDGYGVGYNTRAHYINFGVIAYNSSNCTDLTLFHDTLVRSLVQMQNLLIKYRIEKK
ncbi:hypothetical protein L9F63_004599 [Diploptera punctata]|uniref:Choline/carnitine acyltransferase domain-containing protein n=1 Tax=Diploptera punctata TaxID=6984 RepID=A0AAD8E7R5_DIPPU|nr:hypothetical protein L9F63_004599 [Diploptera punctata]